MDTEDDVRKRHAGFTIGQELASHSVEELDELMELLSAEIVRIKESRDAKSEHLTAAEALFGGKT